MSNSNVGSTTTAGHFVFPGSESDLFYQMLVEGLVAVAVLFLDNFSAFV
jgi:hypothetical protein